MGSFKYIVPAAVLTALIVLGYLHYSGTVTFFSYTKGIDVSAHQGEIDWQKVAQDDVAFAYIKATEADDFKDQNFSKNWSAAKKTAIAVGAYHYFSLAYGGEVQADNFISSVPVETTSLPPVVDLEYVGNSSKRPSKSDFHKELSIFLSAVTDHYGKQPIIYTTKEFYRDYLDPEFATNPTWIRDLFLPPKNHWVLWQYSQWGSIDGINGSVDLDYFGGNVEKLRNL